MRCIYCDKPVFGNDGLTVPQKGPAHVMCFQTQQALQRTFQNLDITSLNDEELKDLYELVIAEQNHRNRSEDESDAVELF